MTLLGREVALLLERVRGVGKAGYEFYIRVKFAAVRPDANAGSNFAGVLGACTTEASARVAATLLAEVNTARLECHANLLTAGYGGVIHGTAMPRHHRLGYSRPGVRVLDDLL